LPAVDVDITFTSITMCCHRGNAAAPVTSMRLIRYRTLDLSRLAQVYRIVEPVERGALGVREAAAAHIAAGLPHVSGHYMGEHWLATYAVLALEA
jgi:uncharacterized membrane protein YjjP (DUF1212 family)